MITVQIRFLIPAILACTFALTSCGRSSSTPVVKSLPLPSVSDANGAGSLKLPDGSDFQTTLYGLKVIDQLQTVRKLPYYILSGIGCNECDATTSIYIHSPSDGPMKDEGNQPRFAYPGRVLNPDDRSLVSEGRMFFGNCAAKNPNAAIWFGRWLGDDKQWHEVIELAEVKDDRLVHVEAKTEVPTLSEAGDAVRKSQCRELAGVDQFEEP